jgi:molybdenum cofactor synthesis domain-containing protein
MSRTRAEILVIGNELLIGQTLDTNSNWLAHRLHAQGWTVERITTVRDSLKSISGSVVEALERRPELLLTVGGLGPTYDDMTIKGLSKAIGKPLALNRDALAMVMMKYRRIEEPAALTAHRRKMAMLPSGAKPLSNPVGTAPGVMVRAGGTTIISFPGVPTEMKAIFKTSVIPILQRSGTLVPSELYVVMAGIVESALAPILESVRGKYSTLYWKSHPMGRETGLRSLIKLHIYTIGKGNETTVRDAAVFLLEQLSRLPARSQ